MGKLGRWRSWAAAALAQVRRAGRPPASGHGARSVMGRQKISCAPGSTGAGKAMPSWRGSMPTMPCTRARTEGLALQALAGRSQGRECGAQLLQRAPPAIGRRNAQGPQQNRERRLAVEPHHERALRCRDHQRRRHGLAGMEEIRRHVREYESAPNESSVIAINCFRPIAELQIAQ